MTSYSIVVPVKDEAQSLPILHKQLKETFDNLGKPYEIIFIDDGSTDNSYNTAKNLSKKDEKIRIIKLRANFGKSYALDKGFELAKGEIIVILDADLQDNPNDIPKLIAKLDEGYDLICGWRKKRADTLTKQISSRLFNMGTSFVSGVKLHDFNCGLKAFRKEVSDETYLRGELHRFIPVLAAKNKFKVTEVIVDNRKRVFGKSKYGKLGIGRSWRGILDLLTAIFITDYLNKPAHFFGGIGLTLFSIGFIFDAYVAYIRIMTGTTQARIPLLLAGILLMLLGIQLISTGLIAEMISHYLNLKNQKQKST